MTELAISRTKAHSYLKDETGENKNTKGTQNIHFEGYKICLEATQLENKINQQENMKLLWIVLKKIKTNS